MLQKAIDYACGYGADCGPILQTGACYNPNTVKAHCNYAVNSYYQRKGQSPEACNFAGSALATNTDPSKLVTFGVLVWLFQSNLDILLLLGVIISK
jgi:X8 domain